MNSNDKQLAKALELCYMARILVCHCVHLTQDRLLGKHRRLFLRDNDARTTDKYRLAGGAVAFHCTSCYRRQWKYPSRAPKMESSSSIKPKVTAGCECQWCQRRRRNQTRETDSKRAARDGCSANTQRPITFEGCVWIKGEGGDET